jgi:excisionase family DNA binding protein
MTTDRTYSIAQAAQILGVGGNQVWKYITTGRLHAERTANGRTWVIHEHDLVQLWAPEKRRTPLSQANIDRVRQLRTAFTTNVEA